MCAMALGVLSAQVMAAPFRIEEAGIADIQHAILTRQITTVGAVKLYLARVKAYNGACVKMPQGLLGPIQTIANAGQVNALGTLNLRPAARKALGFDDHKARSMTDRADADPAMPDALETAAAQDRAFARTGKLVGPLQGAVFSIKDQFDTFDMRTTNGQQVEYANDRPPRDSTVVARLRAAGAIILAKGNRGNYQPRSGFGGVVCNPYDTERSPRASSSGPAVAVSTNLVTCSIGEETGMSIRGPSGTTNIVGLTPTQELISRHGMNGPGLSVRLGPMCRTVEDDARVLSAVVGYDPRDPLTAFSVGRVPVRPYESFIRTGGLKGLRIGVVREYMDRRFFTKMDGQAIDLAEKAVADVRRLGATVVDPGPQGSLFGPCFKQYGPQAFGKLFTRQYPKLFPVDADGKPIGDHVQILADMAAHPERVPDSFNLRTFGALQAVGDSAYWKARYLHDRGDKAVHDRAGLNAKTHWIQDPRFWSSNANINTKSPYGAVHAPPSGADPKELDSADRMLQRFAFQQVVLSCMADRKLDALIYPTMNVPPLKIEAPEEPGINGRDQAHWVMLGQNGFPTITVPAGFTTEVYDRVPDKSSPDGTRLVGPTRAHLPIGVDFAARPFDEGLLLRAAAAYQKGTRHREEPAAFRGLPASRP